MGMKRIDRKEFLGKAVAGGLFVAGSGMAYGQYEEKKEVAEPRLREIREHKPQLDSDLVFQMVSESHRSYEKVSDLLKQEPLLANATWDQGAGDWETALGAASHMGRKDIATLLLDHGARKDIFNMAIMNEASAVRAMVDIDKEIIQVPGPHGITLAFHSIFSGNVDLVAYLKSNGAKIRNGFLRPAAMIGSYEMTKWLLDNGAVYKGRPTFTGKTVAEIAENRGHPEIAKLLNSRLKTL